MVPALAIALTAVLLLMVFWRQHLGSLMQLASLLAALLLMIWLQDNGYLNSKDRQPPVKDRPMPLNPGR
ncbi:hypothetical protein MMMDOFMJ_3270 [Methylobacterium gnaphalii]|uniref:Uncharacterized protein n=2 Tax=Methylobacterium gnaphalii TaxID=1010610 RepID=A0A512JNZ1_9HYPH|nr:hypothetical protein [Methylobacterium gnaphalii]GEP11583.1 hypothetical protein MGN01_34280 [Methylobacterium gnaphalii]GJD70324.1 hypothetical protein MMMDOFMJ_3270 [Methylobacterium gnaphalii]GLS47218.1 hypothetical protein GCM10007885_00620 [Methylobacterium gnaphalii]